MNLPSLFWSEATVIFFNFSCPVTGRRPLPLPQETMILKQAEVYINYHKGINYHYTQSERQEIMGTGHPPSIIWSQGQEKSQKLSKNLAQW
jgi:hypothetical protein